MLFHADLRSFRQLVGLHLTKNKREVNQKKTHFAVYYGSSIYLKPARIAQSV